MKYSNLQYLLWVINSDFISLKLFTVSIALVVNLQGC